MNPTRRESLLRNILTASESRMTKIAQADEEYAAALRQLLEQAMAYEEVIP